MQSVCVTVHFGLVDVGINSTVVSLQVFNV